MSLIEALIAIAILSVAGLSLNSMVVNSAYLNSKATADDTFKSFIADLQDNLNYEDRCTNLLTKSLGNTRITPLQIDADPRPEPYTVRQSTGAPSFVEMRTMEFRGATYETSDPSANYIYNNPGTGIHITKIELNAPAELGVPRRIADPASTTLPKAYIDVERYHTTITVTATRDNLSGVSAADIRKANLDVTILVRPGTYELIQCAGAEGVAGACMTVGGNYDSTAPAGMRCDLRPVSGGCSNGGQFVIKSQGDGAKYCDTRNIGTDRCTCPIGFAPYDTMNFTGIDDTGGRWDFVVFSCMSCTEDKPNALPYSQPITTVN